jgi:hypothetical protein
MPWPAARGTLDLAVSPHNHHASMRPRPRCRHCGDVIGVYEPMILVSSEGGRETSLAAEPQLDATGCTCFHAPCFASDGATGVE